MAETANSGSLVAVKMFPKTKYHLKDDVRTSRMRTLFEGLILIANLEDTAHD